MRKTSPRKFTAFFILPLLLSCCHAPSRVEPRQLAEETYEDLLISFAAHDYRQLKDSLARIKTSGVVDKRIFYIEAIVALAENRPADAVPALQAALVIDPEYAEAHNTLGAVYTQQKHYAEAEEALAKAADNPLYRTPEKAFHQLGFLYQLQDKHERALACYQKALAIKADYFPSHYELSRLYFDLKKFDAAAQEIERARILSPTHPGVWLRKAKIAKACGEYADAVAAFGEVLKLQPRGLFADEAAAELDSLKKYR
ncbi:MAG: tetratricopeptide repeat protein [Deltaproteobacteria bacterium]|nr:tetratricopeptide repeat protein [Deltaproteobacteria bacterium]